MPRIEKVLIAGVFSLDGQNFEVEKNIWIVGGDDEVVGVRRVERLRQIVEAIGRRRVIAIELAREL